MVVERHLERERESARWARKLAPEAHRIAAPRARERGGRSIFSMAPAPARPSGPHCPRRQSRPAQAEIAAPRDRREERERWTAMGGPAQRAGRVGRLVSRRGGRTDSAVHHHEVPTVHHQQCINSASHTVHQQCITNSASPTVSDTRPGPGLAHSPPAGEGEQRSPRARTRPRAPRSAGCAAVAAIPIHLHRSALGRAAAPQAAPHTCRRRASASRAGSRRWPPAHGGPPPAASAAGSLGARTPPWRSSRRPFARVRVASRLDTVRDHRIGEVVVRAPAAGRREHQGVSVLAEHRRQVRQVGPRRHQHVRGARRVQGRQLPQRPRARRDAQARRSREGGQGPGQGWRSLSLSLNGSLSLSQLSPLSHSLILGVCLLPLYSRQSSSV